MTYSFNDLAPVCLTVARENVKRAGGSVKTLDGRKTFLIPVQYPQAPKLER